MAEISDSYRAKVGREQGAERFYMKADGEFKFWDKDIRGDILGNLLASEYTITQHVHSGSVLTTSLFSPVYGHHIFSAPTGVSLASMALPIPSVGMGMVLNFDAFVTDANISVMAQSGGGLTGVTLQTPAGTSISSFCHSAAGYVVLRCFTDGVWSIIETTDSYAGKAAA